ncbi:MAG TPA: LuxR C-terminal-related transcriptional regulator [Rubrivivax sp.]|nr:LuxR C-terminal-related transcriptional regulator [Rubrivivax sp.]HRY86943.1 LuxR C-terminal-related transcriptional regulator [Rubrivivax sp.]HRZ61632.1 LuxR C-terminal-related transcriptional regulator [Rubrivivax sp.]
MTTQTRPRGVAGDALRLEITPPRAPPQWLPRPRLALGDPQRGGAALAVVQAPAGFGKTSLLAQWRIECLGQGAAVAWLQAKPHHDPARLMQALVASVRSAAGRPSFGLTLLEAGSPTGFEAVTVWLAELADLAFDAVLMVDEAERLPADSLAALGYLLHNAPPNLRVAVAARPEVDFGIDDLVGYGQCRLVGAALLRFTLDETLALARERLAERFDLDAAARLHELTEGWPLGVQWTLAAAAASGAVAALPAGVGGDLRRRFVDLMLAKLAPADLDFLTRAAVLDPLHPALCEAAIGGADVSERLARLMRATPVFVAGEHGEWLHMHALVRDVLRERFAALPATERAALHGRAAQWLADQGFVDQAAEQALAAGQRERAFDLVESGLYESFMGFGRQQAVLDWYGRLDPAEIGRRPRLLLTAAWALATSERHDEAQRLVDRLLANAGGDAALRCECALVLGGAALFADDPDRFAALHDPWAQDPPLADALRLKIHANRSSLRALIDGDPALARLAQQRVPAVGQGPDRSYLARWGELIVGLSYLWEGQVQLAERLLAPALAEAEAQLGRRSAFASMVASLLAAAVWEQDRPAEAAALLANRLDVLERQGLPDTVLLGFRTMARIAVGEGAEHRAHELLGALQAAGRARALPRLEVVSLADQARMHARRFRSETCAALCAQIDARLAEPGLPQGPLWRRSVELPRDAARAYAAVAAQDWRRAADALALAEARARELRQGRLLIEMLGMRAFALDQCGERSGPLLREAVDLARTYGLKRVFADAHPGLGDLARRLAEEGDVDVPQPPRPAPAEAQRLQATPSTALTPKEREVLGLLARSLSNKEIALALQVGEETIKWHMKNLFAKLDAGSRKQVVSRARILGLLEFGR